MTLYSLAVTFPYLRMVRGPGVEETNILNLAPLHVQVRDHCHAVIDNPDLLIAEDASFKIATMDGEEWEDTEALLAVHKLQSLGQLPHLRTATVAFFEGALITWIRFSAEFAPGGVIDQLSATERELAWMPSTNDLNEGALGAYRVYMRNKPSSTLLNYNAHAVIRKNDTLTFMDTVYTEEDYAYARKVARKWDADGRERKRRAAQAAFEKKLAEMRREKAEEAQRKLQERQTRLQNAQIAQLEQVDSFTVALLDEQLDKLREIFKDDQVPLKSHRGKKAAKITLLKAALQRHSARESIPDATYYPQEDNIAECWTQDGDELEREMEFETECP
ncbi:hypothetical protein EST38_g10468 [Candolleomyces aberdarensis]|uniref:Uncharacterized protein n=1 Tax=Candolleomyces aberdarensis TaxID=2316362 RepID=A0A4V1Q2K3_9AGAR|nr:hypothetical protein EST38_g10468 [Candolleomyces aberdarensis]